MRRNGHPLKKGGKESASVAWITISNIMTEKVYSTRTQLFVSKRPCCGLYVKQVKFCLTLIVHFDVT